MESNKSYLSVSMPQKILKGDGCTRHIMSELGENHERIFVIGGYKALEVALPALTESANSASKELVSSWFGGEVTEQNFSRLVQEAKDFKADTIIAVGGGKAIDMGKWVADELSVPVVTLPTIAATCSAVSTVTIIYDEQGHYVTMHHLNQGPSMVVLDTDIIAKAPVRWLAAGLGDTLAKLYEFRAISASLPKCSFNSSAYVNGKLCYDLIEEYGEQAIIDNEKQTSSEAIEYVMDAIFLFAGFTSIMGIGDHVGASHALFEGFTINDKTRAYGHGLLVGFGNLVLLELEGRNQQEIIEAIQLAKRCRVPVSIDQIADLTEQELADIAKMAVSTSDMSNMPQKVTQSSLLAAIHKVSELSKVA